uniref:WD repeat domain, phosphoinositide interacting 1 n=1 Tax=Anser cygnoides TaxID=8845 RepID=A0A8B9D2S9_ANSCY
MPAWAAGLHRGQEAENQPSPPPRLIVCLEESIYIHNIKDMKLLKTIMDTPPNATGLCALSINHANSYLAYPGSATSGEIALYDGNTLKTACTIPAHDGPLAALTFNSTGSKLASASEKGTVIRVFSIPGGQKLYEFRRGMKRYVNISSLVFSMDSQFLCASSNTETVHIFKLEHLTDSRPEEPPTWSGYMGKMFQAATNYLPAQVSGMINQDRAFATVRLNTSGQRNVCALSTIQKLPRLLVTTSDGHLYIYNLDPQDGGECVLIKKHSLLGSGKTEENKENDLQPPVPQSYAATVARQSTVPSTSTMPGERRGCPSSGQGSKKAPGAKRQVSKLPRVRCSKTPRVQGRLGQQGPLELTQFLPRDGSGVLCSACWAPCAALLTNRPLAEQKPHPSFGACPTAVCQLPDGFPGVGTMAVEVRSHYFLCRAHYRFS